MTTEIMRRFYQPQSKRAGCYNAAEGKMPSLAVELDSLTAEGVLYERLPEHAVRCFACGHNCLIRPGRRGICKVRFNIGGALRVPHGYVAGLQNDPVEKKPFFHLLPGASALTFGMLGCDFHCGYCQNWVTSQALRDPACEGVGTYIRPIRAEQVVTAAVRSGAEMVVSSYNEPLITSEWAVEIFRLARAQGLGTAFVSNGNATPRGLDYLHPYLDAIKIDLKAMRDRTYRRLGGTLEATLSTIRMAHALGLWLEVVTLVVPGLNDSPEELMDAGRFLAGVSADIPWHVTAFHSDYRMSDTPNTSTATLLRAAEIGQEAGLRFVYAGNLPGSVNSYETTSCPNCRRRLIERRGFFVLSNSLTSDGSCPDCGTRVPGVWRLPRAREQPAYAAAAESPR
jgi:pyruvate formate lyase activating enzyme